MHKLFFAHTAVDNINSFFWNVLIINQNDQIESCKFAM